MSDLHSFFRSLPAGASIAVIFISLMVLPGMKAVAIEPSTSISIEKIEQTERGFVVTGEVTYDGPVSGGGESHSYSLSVIADIKDSMTARFPELPEYLIIRPPAEAQTSIGPGSGPGNLMTIEERDGIDCSSIRTGPKPGTASFELVIPPEHAGKMVRIRAYLNYQYNNVGTPWPAIRYYHEIGYEGVLQPVRTTTSNGDSPGTDATDTDDANGDRSDKKGNKPPETPRPDPYELPPSVDINVPKGNIAGTISTGGDTELGPVTGEETEVTAPGVLPDEIEIPMIINDIKAQLKNPKYTSEQRNELAQTLNDLVQTYGEMEQNQIWLNYYSDTAFLASDLILTYNPIVGPAWSTAKAGVDIANGDYASAALNLATTMGTLKFTTAGKVYNTAQGTITIPAKTYILNNAGQKIQLASDYIKILLSTVGPLPNSTATPPANGGTYTNDQWIPYDQHPVKDLQ